MQVRFQFLPDFLLNSSIIEKGCLEDVTHAYARVRRITKHNNNKPQFPDDVAVYK